MFRKRKNVDERTSTAEAPASTATTRTSTAADTPATTRAPATTREPVAAEAPATVAHRPWYGPTRALTTLLGSAVAVFLLWLATQISEDTNGGYWAQYGLVAA